MEKKEKKPKNKKVFIPLAVVILMVLVIGGYYYMQYMKYEGTDDAVIDCNNISLSPKVMGRIVKLYVDEGDSVKAGQLLAELDSSDLKAQQSQIEANVAQLMTVVEQSQLKLQADENNNKVLEINTEKAKTDFDRANQQKQADVITQQQFENYQKAYQAANAQLEAAQSQLKVVSAQIQSAKASVESGKAQIEVIKTQLKNMRLYSPFDGMVAKRWLLMGDVVQPGQSILTINNDNKLWVSVYIEETKLKNIFIGQKAIYTIDAVPGVDFYGKVFYIGDNTASRFSLIPPSNASGNFTKTTQRVQLKVSIDSVSEGSLNKYHLLMGTSVVIKLVKP